jgi:hypothetical protein
VPQQGTAEIKLEARLLFFRSFTAKVMESGLRQKRLRTIRQLQTSEQGSSAASWRA